MFLGISTPVVTIDVIGEHTGQSSERGGTGEGLALEPPLPIIVSFVLAAAMWRCPGTATLAIVALFGLAAAALDGMELAHLTDRPVLAVLAVLAVLDAIAGLTHLAAAGTAAVGRAAATGSAGPHRCSSVPGDLTPNKPDCRSFLAIQGW